MLKNPDLHCCSTIQSTLYQQANGFHGQSIHILTNAKFRLTNHSIFVIKVIFLKYYPSKFRMPEPKMYCYAEIHREGTDS